MATTDHPKRDPFQLPRIPQPAVRALASIGIVRLDQVANARERELRALHGMGPKAIGILKDTLAERGRSFAPDVTGQA